MRPTFWLNDVMGRAAEYAARERGGKAVDAQRAGDLFGCDVAAKAALAAGGGVADGLNGGDDEHQAEREDRAGLELRLEREQLRHGDDAELADRVAHGGKVDHAEEDRDHIAHDHAEQHVELLGNTLERRVEDERGGERDGGDEQILPRAERIRRRRAERRNADIQNAQTDRDDHAGRDDGGDDLAPVLGRQAQHAFKAAADNDRADHDAVILRGRRKTGGEEREADAHDDRQT